MDHITVQVLCLFQQLRHIRIWALSVYQYKDMNIALVACTQQPGKTAMDTMSYRTGKTVIRTADLQNRLLCKGAGEMCVKYTHKAIK